MCKLTLKQKIYLNVLVPVTVVFVLNNLVLLTLETPGYLIVNLITFVTVITISILSLQLLNDKISENSAVVNIVYADLKKLLAACCQKESLPIAKELARICSELGPVSEVQKNKTPGPFKQGSLRRAFRIDECKAA